MTVDSNNLPTWIQLDNWLALSGRDARLEDVFNGSVVVWLVNEDGGDEQPIGAGNSQAEAIENAWQHVQSWKADSQ